MRRFVAFWRGVFDVRPGEHARLILMALYLMLVLFAYYILKTVARAMFIHRFDIERLPWLYMLIAGIGGILAYLYTKLAVRTNLATAVTWATASSLGCLVLIWWALGFHFAWMLYVLNVWVNLFGIIFVSQGWLIAANVFDSRQAKRLYGILGIGAVIGAGFGSSFTAFTVRAVGNQNLLLASAALIVLSYLVFRVVAAQKGVALARVRAVEEDESAFSFGDIVSAIGRHRHLQVIMSIIGITYMMDVMVDYQFSHMLKEHYTDPEDLTAFSAQFFLYLVGVEFVLQFFLTSVVVSHFGVAGALQIPPVTVAIASVLSFAFPSLFAAAGARMADAATRYTFNRSGMELLYLPLPPDLKNRTKAFMDVFADRMARGLGGLLLLLLTVVIDIATRYIALVVMALCGVSIYLSWRARHEYITTVRKRLAARRLEFEGIRSSVRDPATLELLRQAAESANARQASYALSLLAESRAFPMQSLYAQLVASPLAEVRAKVFELALASATPGLAEQAMAEIETDSEGDQVAARPAVAYALAMSEDPSALARRLIDDPNAAVAEGALEAMSGQSELAQDLITHEWLTLASQDPDPERRRLAAIAVRVRGDEGTEALHKLLNDPDLAVVAAACRSAGVLKNRSYLDALVKRLPHAHLRSTAIEALASYGERIVGTLGDLLDDDLVPNSIRRQIPRVLRLIPHQRSVDVLLKCMAHRNLVIRAAVLRALNRLRESAPGLSYRSASLNRHILDEARDYFEMSAAMAPFSSPQPRTAAALLSRTLEERLRNTLERLFRLLGLRYPPKEVYAAYIAVNRGRKEEFHAALEFLESILERELKRILMPLLETSGQPQAGRELFGIREKSAAAAVQELIHCDDPWLVACAMATAAELKLRELAPEIRNAARHAGAEVNQVARAAAAALA
jgi:AAA family ATP:ADP antiporter